MAPNSTEWVRRRDAAVLTDFEFDSFVYDRLFDFSWQRRLHDCLSGQVKSSLQTRHRESGVGIQRRVGHSADSEEPIAFAFTPVSHKRPNPHFNITHNSLCASFFAALLSPALDGFERLLSLSTVHQHLSRMGVIKSQLIFSKKILREKFSGKLRIEPGPAG